MGIGFLLGVEVRALSTAETEPLAQRVKSWTLDTCLGICGYSSLFRLAVNG